jgi:hypothetical protein
MAQKTRDLLACGAFAGPLFVAVVVIQALTRNGYDLAEHPLSLLTLGDFGWIQSANFVVAGMLVGAFAVGLRRALEVKGRTNSLSRSQGTGASEIASSRDVIGRTRI